MPTRHHINVKKWCPIVVALVFWGLSGTSQAEPPRPALHHDLQYFAPPPAATDSPAPGGSGSPTVDTLPGAFGDDGEEIQMMTETVVEGTFVDPFDVGESESVQDPWESFNATMFAFNYRVDRYLMRPVAKAYNVVIPPDVQNSLAGAVDNMGFVARLLNNLFQGKFREAGIETQRFFINTTIGVGGLFDVATHMFEIEAPPTEDTGQTLAVYGVGTGPYLVLPLLPPMTVRDVAGNAGDIFLNPVNYVIPFFPNLGVNAMDRINDRSLNLERFEGIEESTIDLYGAARSAYFERRTKDARE